ncbi:MAG: hypothetical protein KDK36_08290 [Leptospiraceae bacterium]|nr:hypothetical protein [Leptospiraceae bacterium]
MKIFIYLILTSLFTYIILFFNNKEFSNIPIIQESWAWNKSSEFGIANDSRYKEKPLKIANGYKVGKESFLFSLNKKAILDEDGDLTDFPVLGEGYLTYKKIGNKITYFSKRGEILWKKPFSSYPISTYKGNLTFLISGDGNQILLIDKNGNPTGEKQLDGRFFTDMSQSVSFGSVLLFSGGEIFRLDSSGKLIYKLSNNDSKVLRFFKSITLSENGELAAVHYFENNKDYISLLDKEGKPTGLKILLPHIYPHKIFMSLNNKGKLLTNLRDAILLFDTDGKILHKTIKKKKESVYQVSFSNGEYFIAGFKDTILFLNDKGELFKKKKLGLGPWRLYPSDHPDSFFLETRDDVIYFHQFE